MGFVTFEGIKKLAIKDHIQSFVLIHHWRFLKCMDKWLGCCVKSDKDGRV